MAIICAKKYYYIICIFCDILHSLFSATSIIDKCLTFFWSVVFIWITNIFTIFVYVLLAVSIRYGRTANSAIDNICT